MKNYFALNGASIRSAAALLTLIGSSLVAPNPALAVQPPDHELYTITRFAGIPASPGFPEGIVVHGNRIFVSGPAAFDNGGAPASAIKIYDRKTAVLVQTIVVTGEKTNLEHALSNVAVDLEGRIYALSTQLGLIRFQKQGNSYVQQAYGDPLPDLPTCTDSPDEPCSPTHGDLPPLANDIVFDANGYAYVTDSLQATIWRYQRGGGAPTVWFQSPLFEGGGFFPFGLNGIRLDPMRGYLYFAVSTTADNPGNGKIYRLSLAKPVDLELFYDFTLGEFPDQLAFGATGDLYVSLAGSNQISVINSGGEEVTRIASLPGDVTPLDNPAGIAFDSAKKSLLIVNHALLSGIPAHFAVLKSFVDDPGNPLETPSLP